MILAVSLNAAMDRTLLVGPLAAGAVHRAGAVDVQMGGKGLNVAKFARALGAAVTATGFAGGLVGRFLREEAARLGIADALVPIRASTRICYIFVHGEGGGHPTVVNEPGPQVEAAEVQRLVETFARLVPGAALAVLSGSLPPGAPPDLYAHLIRLAGRSGVRCILDASGEPLRLGIAARPWLIAPNEAEFAELTGGPWRDAAELRRRCVALLEAGVQNVIVTLGEAGSVLATAAGSWRVVPPRVAAVNPVGCGDALVGGAAACVDGGGSLLEALRLGTACAAANAARPFPYAPARAELDPLLAEVAVEPW